jgi:outer membrane protein assembly factor BamB
MMRTSRPLRLMPCLISCLAVLWLFTVPSGAGDWPQILGPGRNGIAAADEKLADRWPEGGPKLVWQREGLGSGFAGVAVAAGKVVLFHRVDDEEIAECLDAATGKPLWKASFPTTFRGGVSPDHGPRCVPVVHKDQILLYGAGGDLRCLAAADGKRLWSRAAFKDFGAPDGYFGAGSSPIVIGERVLVNVGGHRRGAGIVAFSLDKGETLWKATDNEASYSSPITATIGGTEQATEQAIEQAIFVTRLQTLAINPASGKVSWSIRFGSRGANVNAANPLVIDGHLFLSASYGIGAVYAKLTDRGPEVVWKNDDVMSSQYTTCVAKDGYLYGIDGREDLGEAQLRCIDPKAGKVVWSKDGLGKGTLILADGKILIQTTAGRLHLTEASPTGYRELASAEVAGPKTFALPALAGGRLYVRGPDVLKCLDLAEGL